ncbi:MAG: MFS transporter [Novosphingobium sp.]|nr:MFS transporter [Novosphingobium sp.]MCP5402897.1 MFS transporter [Novosphingobium sp.]
MASERPGVSAGNLSLAACIALCGMAPLSGLALSGIAPVMPAISDEFAHYPNSGMLVRLMMSALSAAMVFGALATGLLAERIGQLRLLMVLLALYAVSGAGIFLLDNLYAMVGFRIVQGIANAGAGVLAMALITTRIPADRRDRWLGFFSVTGAVGVMLLMLVVGAVANLGWRYVFLMFLLALPVAVAVLLTLPPPEPGRAEPASPETGGAGAGIPWGLTIFGLICGSIVTTISMYLPYHVADIGHGAPETVAMLMVVGAGMSALTAFSFGWIRARLSALQTFVIGFAVTAAGLVLLVAAREMPLLYAGMAINGAGLGVIMPNLFSAAAAAVPAEQRARMLGFVRAGIYAGPLVAQPLFEWVMLNWGAGASILAIAAISLFALAISVLSRGIFAPAVEAY